MLDDSKAPYPVAGPGATGQMMDRAHATGGDMLPSEHAQSAAMSAKPATAADLNAALRDLDGAGEIPVLVVTSKDLSRDEAAWLSRYSDHIFQKGSYDRGALVSAIRTTLEKQSSSAAESRSCKCLRRTGTGDGNNNRKEGWTDPALGRSAECGP